MKRSAIISIAATLALAASAVYAQTGGAKGHEHGTPGPCCENPAKAQAYKAAGVVKKTDASKGTVSIAHGAVKELNWPAMTMAFKVKDKALLDKLAVDKKVEFSFVQEGKDYVVTAVQ